MSGNKIEKTECDESTGDFKYYVGTEEKTVDRTTKFKCYCECELGVILALQSKRGGAAPKHIMHLKFTLNFSDEEIIPEEQNKKNEEKMTYGIVIAGVVSGVATVREYGVGTMAH